MKKKILITGPILSQSGYGEHARLIYRALKTREDLFEIFINPIRWAKTSWLWEDDAERRDIDMLIGKTQAYRAHEGQFDMCFMVTIPSEWENYRAAPINVGVTAGIESNKISAKWIHSSNLFADKIIVPSSFSKRIYDASIYNAEDSHSNPVTLRIAKPIEVINYPVKKYEEVNLDIELDYDFNFLTVAQWGPRKNIQNTLRWFVEEFIDQKVGLVLKLNKANNSIADNEAVTVALEEILQEYPDRKCKVYLIHGYFNNDEMHSLYKHSKIKALLAISHGEGYGLPIFEAAYCGLPVIAHDWGGQTDFLYANTKDKKGKIKRKSLYVKVDYDMAPIQESAVWDTVLDKDSMWAFPKQGSCKMKMRAVYKNYGIYKSQAKKLQKKILKNFTEEKIYKQIVDSVFGKVAPPLVKPEYIFVSDFFSDQLTGGAEMSFQTIMDSCPSEALFRINSVELSEEYLERYKNCRWIFGNIAHIKDDVLQKIISSKIEYFFVEFDYKFCEYRNPLLYEHLEDKECEYLETEKGKLIGEFVNNSIRTFFMSENQRKMYLKYLNNLKEEKTDVLSSLFNENFFEKINSLKKNQNGKNGWIVLGSRSWIKGSQESEQWCKENNLDYEVVFDLSHEQLLEKLASAEGICFKPTGLDTCPRFVIEAKLLDCKLELNDNVQHLEEDWFKTNDYKKTTSYLKNRKDFFWDRVVNA